MEIKVVRLVGFFVFILSFALSTYAMNGQTTYQAKIIKPDGQPLQASNVYFKFSILDPSGSCVLYAEDFLNVNMNDSNGLTSFALGAGIRSYPTSGTVQSFQNAFDNSISSHSCQSSGPYNPNATDTRKVVMQFNDGNGWQTVPAMTLNAVPYAMYAAKSQDSQKLNNKADTDFVEYSTLASLSCASDQAIKFNGVSFSCITVGVGSSGITSVTTSGTVLTTGGSASAPVISISVASFSSDGYLTSSDWNTFNNKITSSAASIAQVLGYIPADNAASGTYAQKANNLSDLTNIVTARTNLGLGTFATASSIDLGGASATGTLAIARLPSFSGDATIAAASNTIILSNSGVAAGTYTKVTVDAKGRVTSSAQIADSDVIIALGYTPANSATITSSQWATSGTTINYMNGNVGIGTTAPVTALDVSGGVRIGAESTTCAPALAGTLRYNASNVEYCNGITWSAFGVSGAGITNFNGSTSGTQSFVTGAGGTAPNFNTSNGVHTLNLPLASAGSVTAGLVSNADYATFTNKITSSAASIAQVLGYIPADNAASGTYAQKANNLSDLTNVATARTNLGLGTFATASSIDLGSASATGTLAIARLPSFSGDATIAAASNTIILSNSGVAAGTYTKVIVDGKGRVTSGSQFTASDVATVLGYTPANSATVASSQWNTSGTTINYITGNVGIGTTSPEAKLTLDSDGGILAKGVDGAGATLTATGAGSRMIWYPRKAAFRAGAVNGSGRWDNANIGDYSAAFGWNTLASGDNSFAAGDSSRASGTATVAMGFASNANAESSVAIGESVTANGMYSSAFGSESTANADYSIALGHYVTANAMDQVTVGRFNLPTGTEASGTDVATDPIFVVGNGTGLGVLRSNALMILKNGNVGIGTTTPVTKLEVSGGIRIGAESTTCAPALAGTLRYNASNVEYCNGTSWSAFGVSGAGITAFNGSTSGTQTFATGITGTVFNISTANGIHTLNIPLAASSSVIAGLLSNSDYAIFTNKVSATSAAVIAALGYTPADNSASGTYALKANNLSDLASATVARSNLGLGTLATLNFIDLSGSQASGTLAAARLPAFTGDVTSTLGTSVLTLSNVGAGVTSGAQYTKVTVDGKGRVTSGAQFTASDVTTALGYTPASASAATQWLTSGSTVSYSAGNVGIGTSAPQAALHVDGEIYAAAIRDTSNPATYYLDPANSGMSGQFAGFIVGSNFWAAGGSASVAAFNFGNAGGQQDTGIFSPAADILAVTTAGSERLRIDASGNVGIGTTTPVTKLEVSGGIRIGAESTTCAPALAGTLRYNASNVEYCNGTSWSAFGVSGAGITNFNGSTSGTQSFVTGAGGTAPNFNTSNGVHTLNVPLASAGSVTAGLISNADYTSFANKITSSAAAISQVLGFTPVSTTTLSNYILKANNLSDLTNVATARTNLGLGTFATASTIDLSSASATGTLAIARLPAFTGDVVTTAGSNTVTVDGLQGRSVLSTAPTSGQVLAYNGSAWAPVTVGSGITNFNGSTSGTQTFATGITGTVFNISTANGIHTLNIPLAASSSVIAGLLSNSDYAIFTNKVSATSSAVIAALGYTPANSATLSVAYLDAASNLSDLASSATARTNLGLGTAATLNVGTGINNILQLNGSSQIPAVNAALVTNLNASNISTGTVDAARLPTAAAAQDGIVNQLAQSFTGIKTFINNMILQGTLSVTGIITANAGVSTTTVTAATVSATGQIAADTIKLANSVATCNLAAEGSIKYNSTSKKIEFCNGTTWTYNPQGPVSATVSIGLPSPAVVSSGAVAFVVSYSSNVDIPTIILNAGQITVSATGVTGCGVGSITGAGVSRTVTIISCLGTGSVSLMVASGTATSTSGELAPEAGPSVAFSVDNQGPNAPTGVSLGTIPMTLLDTPTISYTAATDVGGGAVASHQVRILKTSDSSVLRDWATHVSGDDIKNIALEFNTAYSVYVRGIDSLGNIGTSTAATNWTTSSDPCAQGGVSPGTLCTGGVYYIGSLSWGTSSVTSGPANKYMTTPGNCGEIPAGQKVTTANTPGGDYPHSEFTPTCNNTTDTLTKDWNDGTSNWYDIPGLTNYATNIGTGSGAANVDNNYGSTNTTNIVAITVGAQGGYHAAARYCDKLSYGGYTDWYLPNRYELNLMFTNKTLVPGLDISTSWYWSSTEYNSAQAWLQRFNDGYQTYTSENLTYRLRCVRRF